MTSSVVDIADFKAEDDEVLYRFEGEAVARTKGKLTSAANLEIEDKVFAVDETLRLMVEVRVSSVDHRVATDGKLERVHTMKALDALVVDWAFDVNSLRP